MYFAISTCLNTKASTMRLAATNVKAAAAILAFVSLSVRTSHRTDRMQACCHLGRKKLLPFLSPPP